MLLACVLLIYGVMHKYSCFRLLMSEPKQKSKEGRERERFEACLFCFSLPDFPASFLSEVAVWMAV